MKHKTPPLFLRVAGGLMIFYVHGWHKLKGWIAYRRYNTPWKLAEEVSEMHFPAPVASAVAATGVQLICSLFLIAGLFTRINAALLVGVLGVAIIQNLLTKRDAQLAVLYTLIVATLALLGGGRFSLDAWLENRHGKEMALSSNLFETGIPTYSDTLTLTLPTPTSLTVAMQAANPRHGLAFCLLHR